MKNISLLALFSIFFTYSTFSQAAMVVYSDEVGSGVVMTYSGTLDLTGMPLGNIAAPGSSQISPLHNYFLASTGNDMQFLDNPYSSTTGSVGSSGATLATSQSGDAFYFYGNMGVSTSYLSGDSLSGSLTFAGSTFSTMGLIENAIRVNTLTSGDTITWNIFADPATPVPLPASLPLLLIGLAGMGFVSRFRKSV